MSSQIHRSFFITKEVEQQFHNEWLEVQKTTRTSKSEIMEKLMWLWIKSQRKKRMGK